MNFIYNIHYFHISQEKAEKERKEKEKNPIKEIANTQKAVQKWKPPNKEKSNLSQSDTSDKLPGSVQSNGTAGNNDSKDSKDKVGTDNKSGTVTVNGKSFQKYGKGRNPMVKLPSKDSGYSVQSQGSSQSGGGKETPRDEADSISLDSDANPRKADSGTGSMLQGLDMEQPPSDKKDSKKMLKEATFGNVSHGDAMHHGLSCLANWLGLYGSPVAVRPAVKHN